MKKILLRYFFSIFCLVIVTSCGKDVKTPNNKPATAAKPAAKPITQTLTTSTSTQNGSTHTCGSGQSGSQTTPGY